MSSNYPFLQLEMQLPDGSILKLGEDILIIDGGLVLLGEVAFIDVSSVEPNVPGSMPTIKSPIKDVIRHTLNAGIPPNLNKQRAGLRYVDDPTPTGVRFCRVSNAEYKKLKAWHDDHGATGGTHDKSQAPNPADIPWTPTGTGEGKGGESGGDPTGGGDVGEQGGGKTGEGDVKIHDADRDADHNISPQEKYDYQQANPGEKIRTGDYTDPSQVVKKK